MRRSVVMLAALSGLALPAAGQPAPEARPPEPTQIGACVFTAITSVTTRLTDNRGNAVVGSGSAVILANGLWLGGHDTVSAIEESRVGDRVLVCMVAEDENCRGRSFVVRVFTTTNMRTLRSWTRANSSRGC